jgi:D-cysteine desulfhydrase family pyridoxal phosphate-dependent enzyme
MKLIPRLSFAHLPTRIEPMPRLSAHLGGPSIWIKRDDQTGLAFGGNKTRKLEFLVAQAQADRARTLITAGALQSNHCRQTAAAAARFGFDCILVLSGEPPTRLTANFLLDTLFGAHILWTDRTGREAALKAAFEAAWSEGRRPFLIPYGGSSPVGAAGYVHAVQELLDQCVESSLNIPIPGWIVFASSSGGTQAGLAAGARMLPIPSKVLGISVDEPRSVLCPRAASLATQTAELLGRPDLHFTAEDILVNDDLIGPGYGNMTGAEKEAIRLFARLEGILLDPVYTGRAAAGMINLVQQGTFSKDEMVLFWHTGGSPALFADRYTEVVD